jgi:hypothetical protein
MFVIGFQYCIAVHGIYGGVHTLLDIVIQTYTP